ncbi:Two component system response regulator/histidine kinase, methyl-accepting receptor domain-containing protein [Desulfonema limicola]|uniref:histidine kinase n=1 Tax=Desulfonema limicola TaxID=45656 RepID=A0A975B4H9_9BACT|nr:response regulator [Desulfonema limicola]QTA78633.1 Two component system response regulator/histidine kinase, methyl-accepting receptor domain-containing protein [Desulfonema limicola]
MILNRFTIQTRLMWAFVIMLFVFIIFGFISIYKMNQLGKLTKTLYEHPFQVSNAALRASMGVIKIHKTMKAIALFESKMELDDAVYQIRDEESLVYKNLDIIEKQILGEQGKKLEKEARNFFAGWRPLRNEVIDMIIKEHTINPDTRRKVADYVDALENKMLELRNYAENKAEGFMQDAEKIQENTIQATILIILGAAFFSFFIAFLMINSILSCINALRDTMAEIKSSGNLIYSDINGSNEITEMSQHFNVLIDMLKNQLWTRDGLNALNHELTGENSFGALVNSSISFVSRYIDACTGALYIYDNEKSICELKGAYAFVERRHLSNKFALGQGIVGQAALEKKPILLKNIISEKVCAITGTVSEPPKNIYAVPLIHEEKLYGVMETAAFEDISPVKKDFIDSAAGIISTSLYTSFQREQINSLLDSEQKSNKALQSKTDELSQTNEKLTTLNDELKAQTEELRVQKHELETQQIQVEEADRLKSEFLSNMSHELRTPLNSVLALSQLMISRGTGINPEQEAEYLKVIERNGRHLLSLINDILDLSKIEAGRMDLFLTDFSPSQVVNNVLETIAPLADKKNLIIKKDIDEDLMINSDKDKLHQIILNIVSNAVKFTETGTIDIKVKKSETKICFIVHDTGIGIPESELERIFDEFRQVDGSTTRIFEGTGLGLAICQKLAGLLKGDIQAESEIGAGSTFTLNIPLKFNNQDKDNITEIRPVQNLPEIPKIEVSKTVLVIDDDEQIRLMIKSYLIDAGYNVETARGGRQGLDMAYRLKPFAITLDIMMPDMDGWEVIRELKTSKHTADIPVIIVSVSDDRATGTALGAAGYVLKPVDRNILLSEINKLASVCQVKHILAVDDDPIVLRQIADLLGEKGYQVETASSGHEGIAKAAANPPDVMVLDLMMPEMDGFSVLARIRKEPAISDLPVIILTARNLNKSDRIRLQDTVHRVVTKTAMDNNELLDNLQKALSAIPCSKPLKKQKPMILVVEDNEIAAIQISSALEEKDYFVHTVFGGAEAIEFVRHSIPDAVILDLMMPGVDGFQFLESIRSTPETAKLPVLVLTAKELTAQDRARLTHNNIQQLIQKGAVDREQLAACVSKLLPKDDQQADAPKKIKKKDLIKPELKTNLKPGKSILLVEDNPDNLITITAILDEFGYNYISADDGRKAVDKAKQLMPGLILMDVQLPVLSGLDAARKIKSDPLTASIPIIAVTAKAMRGDREKILASGCDDYLSKPIEPGRLIEMIQQWTS